MDNKKPTHKKQRLDVFIVTKGIVETRNRAKQLIKEGHVRVNRKVCNKSGALITGDELIEVNKNAIPYVSRGGVKLDYALKVFKINVDNRVCLDVGASTGGFTDCLLKYGAKFVYAVDVGRGQLHSSLRNNPRLLYLEGVDIRNFSLPENKLVDLVCIDVSFISLTLVLPIIKKFLSFDGEMIILIKPQFEVGLGKTNKRGIVKTKQDLYEALSKVLTCAQELKLFPVDIVRSPIKGKEGNIEYLAYLKLETSRRFYSTDYLIST